MEIRRGTHWLYLGGEEGYNLVHIITLVEESEKAGVKLIDISTCSLYDQEGEEDSGYTWKGPLSVFVKQFKPLGPPEEAMS
jgi:hypothetical protein